MRRVGRDRSKSICKFRSSIQMSSDSADSNEPGHCHMDGANIVRTIPTPILGLAKVIQGSSPSWFSSEENGLSQAHLKHLSSLEMYNRRQPQHHIWPVQYHINRPIRTTRNVPHPPRILQDDLLVQHPIIFDRQNMDRETRINQQCYLTCALARANYTSRPSDRIGPRRDDVMMN